MRAVAVAVGVGLAAGWGWAGPFQQEQVPGSVMWVAHADFENLRQTEIGRFLVGKLSAGDSGNKLAAFAAAFQFDLLRDMASVTLYGKTQAPEDAVVLLNGAFKEDHLLTLLKANASYETEAHGNRVVHSWIDENKQAEGRKFGCFLSPRVLAISRGQPALTEALDILDGQGRTFDAAAFGGVPADAAFFVAVANLAGMQNLSPQAAVLGQAESASLSMGEREGRLVGGVSLRARDSQGATNMQAVAQGLLALAHMGQEKAPGLVRVAQALKVTMDGRDVRVDAAIPVADAISMIEDGMRRRAPAQ